jgi:hypothetical protein
MAKKSKKSAGVNGLSDDDIVEASAEAAPIIDLECHYRQYDEERKGYHYLVQWNGEDLSGAIVIVNGIERLVTSTKFGEGGRALLFVKDAS